ncbi:GTP-binding protein [Lawsonella clevelandensis]|uniref:CobW family GTP-binding protein n=1 Tax=Lawsonella clevelandensis TaxID=1528099 RepID=UPI0006B4F5C5|nr:GTP-binding protein [Lawsonella clevelandensis]MDU7193782.1 GTP-binding protein [Lawsonella clevelandensis]
MDIPSTNASTSASATSPRVPVFVLAGFLGSGKTTLLNHLLQDDHGIKLAVIVNDFGTIPVDAMLVAGQVDSLVSMANGCLCCESSDEELDAALDQLAHTPGVEGIIIEASGLAEPQVLMSMVATATTVTEVAVGGLIEVIDAGEVLDTVRQHPAVVKRLHNADLIVLNKADRVEPAELQQVRQLLAEAAPAVMTVTTAYGRVDARVLFDRPQAAPQNFAELVAEHRDQYAEHSHHEHDHHADHAHSGHGDYEHCHDDGHDHHESCDCSEHHHGHDHHDHHHLHDSYRTVSLSLHAPLHPARFMDFVRNGAGGAYRVKGFLQLAGPREPESFVFEKTGQHIALQRWFPQGSANMTPATAAPTGTAPADSAPADVMLADPMSADTALSGSEESAQSGLVFIGVELDESAIAEVCAACVWEGTEADPVSEGELWAFYPYLEDVAADPEDYWWEDWEGESAAGEVYLVEPEDDPTFLP